MFSCPSQMAIVDISTPACSKFIAALWRNKSKLLDLLRHTKAMHLTEANVNPIFITVSLILLLVFTNDEVKINFNKDISFINLGYLFLILLISFIKSFSTEILFRGWVYDILSSRYKRIIALMITALIPTIIQYIDQRIFSIHLLYGFFLNLFLILIVDFSKSIMQTISFSCIYEVIKKYILGMELSEIQFDSIFYISIDKSNLYYVENSLYAVGVLIIIMIMYILLNLPSRR